jgi:hypothetical protein
MPLLARRWPALAEGSARRAIAQEINVKTEAEFNAKKLNRVVHARYGLPAWPGLPVCLPLTCDARGQR